MVSTGSGEERAPEDATVVTERREEMRDKAKSLRDQYRRQHRRNRWILQGGLVLVLIAAVASIALVIANSATPAPTGPRNMLSDGIKIGAGYEAVSTLGLKADEQPVPSGPNDDDVIDIRVYVDYLCVHCSEFDDENAEQIGAWIEQGAVTLEVHPLALLDAQSEGTNYSTRAANAAACVASHAPNEFFSFNSALLAAQPRGGEGGLSDERILAVVEKAGVATTPAIEECITSQQYRSWVKAATVRALNGPLPGADIEAVRATPTILVNGEKHTYSYPFKAKDLAQVISKAAGTVFNKQSTEEKSVPPADAPAEEAPADAEPTA